MLSGPPIPQGAISVTHRMSADQPKALELELSAVHSYPLGPGADRKVVATFFPVSRPFFLKLLLRRRYFGAFLLGRFVLGGISFQLLQFLLNAVDYAFFLVAFFLAFFFVAMAISITVKGTNTPNPPVLARAIQPPEYSPAGRTRYRLATTGQARRKKGTIVGERTGNTGFARPRYF